MTEPTEAEKRNSPHINRVATFADQIFAVKSQVIEGFDWKNIIKQSQAIAGEIRSLYNNRETALVCTKLDEVEFWANEEDIEQVRGKLTEARGWCLKYIEVLKQS